MEKIKLKKIHDVVDCMHDMGILDSYWEEKMRIDILNDLNNRIRLKKDDLEMSRKVVKLSNLLKSIENIKKQKMILLR